MFVLLIMYLPDELVSEILSYGDVYVTQKYDGVLRQLNYHKKEYDYRRFYDNLSQWYLKPSSHYKLYILMKNQIKKRLDQYIYTPNPDCFYNINVFSDNLDNIHCQFINYNTGTIFHILNMIDY